jgi:hypothetical protein
VAQVVDRETGQTIEIPDEELGAAVASGRFGVAPGTRIPVVNEAGEVGTLDFEHLQSGAAATGGFKPATADQIREAKLQQEHGEGLGTVRAGAEAVGRGLTFGGLDVAMRALGADAEGLRERRDRNPIVSTAGEVAGAVAPLLATGGAGAVGLGVRTAGAIPRAVAATGRAVESGVARVAGQGLLGRGAAMGAAGAVEGGLFGVGQAVSGAALDEAPQDPGELAEYVIGHVGQGMLMGGAAGALLGTGAAAVERGVAKGRDLGARLFGRAGREAVEDGIQVADGPLARALRDDPSVARGVDEARRGVLDQVREFPEAAAAKRGWEAHRQKTSVAFREDLTALEKHSDVVFQTQNIADKYREAASLFQKGGHAPVRQLAEASNEAITALKGELQRILKGKGAHRSWERSGSKRLLDFVESQEGAMAKALESGSDDAVAVIFSSMDDIKRLVGNTQDGMRAKGGSGVRDLLRGKYDDFLKTLEREDLWGKTATAMQRKENAGWVPYLDTSRAFRDDFLTHKGGGRSINKFDTVNRGDSGKIGSFLTQFGREANFNREDIFVRTLQSRNRLAQELASRPSASAAVKKAAAEIDATTKRVLATVEETRNLSARAQQFDQMTEMADRTFGGKAALKMAVLGEQAVRTVVDTSQAMARMAGIHNQVSKRVKDAAKAAMVTAKATAVRVGEAAPIAAAAVAETKGTRKERFDRQLQLANEFRSNPTAFSQRIADQIRSVNTVSPAVASAMAATSTRAAEFLASKAPVPNIRGSVLRPDLDKTQRVSDGDMARFLRYATAVEQPMTVVDAIQRGDVTREGIETLREVYPALHRQLVEGIHEQVGQLEKEPPYSVLKQLSIILEQPTHPSLEPRAIASAQAGYAAAMQPKEDAIAPSARQSTNIAGQHQTKTEKLAEGLGTK